MGVVGRIYDHFGLTLSDEAQQRMQAWAARNAQAGEGGHSYEKITDKGPLREAFGDYLDRFGFA